MQRFNCLLMPLLTLVLSGCAASQPVCAPVKAAPAPGHIQQDLEWFFDKGWQS